MANKVAKAKGKAKREEQPAVGGKCKFVQERRGLPFTSNVLMWKEDGTWQYREGKCVSLRHLFAKCGRAPQHGGSVRPGQKAFVLAAS